MFARFTASARRVMQRAFREAKRWQHDFVGTEHLLFGLLCDSEGPATSLLRSLGAHPEPLLQKVETALQRHDGGVAMEQFPLSPASRRVFRAAADEATEFRHQMIGPEHLLLGVLRESDCEAALILSNAGVTFAAVREAAARIAPDADAEAQIQASALRLGDNPSVDELEAWIAPKITVERPTDASLTLPGAAASPDSAAASDIERQLRRTQLVLGAVLGFGFAYWLTGWNLAIIGGLVGATVARVQSSLIGAVAGACCGLFLAPYHRDAELGPLGPVLLAMLGALLGSFLGDGWRFSSTPRPDLPLEPSGIGVTPETPLHVGAIVFILAQGRWWRGVVLALERDGQVRVRYPGAEGDFEETVPRKVLQLPP